MEKKDKTLTYKSYLIPFVLIVLLFFMWGFARAILDVLNKHFQTVMHISIAQSSLIQVATYMGYFITALPAGMYIMRYGYRRGIVTGLLIFAAGALLFVPSMWSGTFMAFVGALFVIGCGLTFLEVSANPYVTLVGPVETSYSRLNLAQSFNGLGCVLAPLLVGRFLFSGADADVSVPYVIMGILVVVAAVAFSRVPLPDIIRNDSQQGVASGTLLKNRSFLYGVGALLAYEVSEICINSYFVNFTTAMNWLTSIDASRVVSLALVLFMAGRFAGSWMMRFLSAEMMLLICASGSVACVIIVLLDIQEVSLCALILNYAFEAIMFPTVFSLSLRGLSPVETKRAGSILMMTPVGGCTFLLMGLIADNAGPVVPFVLPLAGYVIVAAYARWLHRNFR